MATRIRCNGVDLAVEDSGGGGPTVLFSHGLLYSLQMWEARTSGRYFLP
ncbi:MAG TPA: alpha/beta hydrolase [Myxococcaceae bacterium]|nr:alpha/beta hydrolase [Myxococcaceae bacterium]